MSAVLKIEGEEGVALANRLATLKRTSPEDAVIKAMRAEVARDEDIQARLARIHQLTAEIRAGLGEPLPSSTDHNLLYGDDGLPV